MKPGVRKDDSRPAVRVDNLPSPAPAALAAPKPSAPKEADEKSFHYAVELLGNAIWKRSINEEKNYKDWKSVPRSGVSFRISREVVKAEFDTSQLKALAALKGTTIQTKYATGYPTTITIDKHLGLDVSMTSKSPVAVPKHEANKVLNEFGFLMMNPKVNSERLTFSRA
jgi:hypothetical protein